MRLEHLEAFLRHQVWKREYITIDDICELLGQSQGSATWWGAISRRRIIVAQLKSFDFGDYVVGRRGHPSRFVFNPKVAEMFAAFPFPLSDGRVISLVLPPDMPPEDIDRLCMYLQSFKLEEGTCTKTQ